MDSRRKDVSTRSGPDKYVRAFQSLRMRGRIQRILGVQRRFSGVCARLDGDQRIEAICGNSLFILYKLVLVRKAFNLLRDGAPAEAVDELFRYIFDLMHLDYAGANCRLDSMSAAQVETIERTAGVILLEDEQSLVDLADRYLDVGLTRSDFLDAVATVAAVSSLMSDFFSPEN